MKSLLVDAIRQANGTDTDRALSDSGSFDADDEALGATANDEVVDESGELELMSTTRMLVASESTEPIAAAEADDSERPKSTDDDAPIIEPAIADTRYMSADDPTAATNYDEEVDFSVTIVGELFAPVQQQKMPRMAKFAPLLCVALAAAVAASWLTYQQLGAIRGGVGIGPAVAHARASHTPGVAKAGATGGPQARFPFLENLSETDYEEVAQ